MGDKRKMTKDEMKNRISLALKDPILQQGFEIICKENAELRKTISQFQKDSYCGVCHFKTKTQLKQAKEIIREFMKYEINEYDGSLEIHFEELKKQAEQFLSEVENV